MILLSFVVLALGVMIPWVFGGFNIETEAIETTHQTHSVTHLADNRLCRQAREDHGLWPSN